MDPAERRGELAGIGIAQRNRDHRDGLAGREHRSGAIHPQHRYPGIGRQSRTGAGFYIRSDNWQEIQVSTDTNGRLISSGYIGADASIESKGLEMETAFEPSTGLTLTANLGYSDARYRDLRINAATNLKGRRVKLVPAYDGYLAARYQTARGLFGRVELALAGRHALESRGEAMQPATQTLGLQAGYDASNLTLRLFAENVTNVRRHTGIAFRNLAFGNDGNWYAPIGRGRQFGVEASWRL